MKHIISRLQYVFSLTLFVLTLSCATFFVAAPLTTFAAWNNQPYNPGQTLNPECGPTDENCTVALTWATTTTGIAYTGGHVGIGTTDTQNSTLTIQQGLGTTNILTNGDFNGTSSGWSVGDGWSYQNGSMHYVSPTLDPTPIDSVQLDSAGTAYRTGDVVGISGGNNDAQITVNQTWGGFISLTVTQAGSGYTVGDVVTVNNADENYNDDATAIVDSVDGSGGITGLTVTNAGTNYPSTGGFALAGGTGSDAWVTGNIGVGAIQYFDITNYGTGYVSGTYSATGGSGSGATLTVIAGNSDGFPFLIPQVTPIEGHIYDVSFDVGGTVGQLMVCHFPYSEGDCQVYDAGSGTHTFSFTWGPDGPFGSTALLILPNNGNNTLFNGTIDNISMIDQAGTEYLPGLTFIQSDQSSSLQIGLDEENGNGGQQHGFMIKTVDSNGYFHEASIYLHDTNNTRYEYALPSLGQNETDTFCFQNLGNCAGESKWKTATSTQNIFFNTGFVGIGTSTPTAAFSVVGSGTSSISFTQIAGYETNTPSRDIRIQGNTMYAANGNRLEVYDISNPAVQYNFSDYNFGDPVNVVRVNGNVAYLGVGNTFYVMDISNSSSQAPSVLGSTTTDMTITDIQIQGNYAYVIDQGTSLYVYDISNITPGNPGEPIPVTTESSTFYSRQGNTIIGNLVLGGNYAYIIENEILEVVDISNPHYITHVSTFSIDGNWFGEGIALSDDGNYLYLTRDAGDGNTFLVLDVSDKNNIHQVGSANIGNYRIYTSIVMHNGKAYVADGQEDSVYAINVSNPTNPTIMGHTVTNDNSFGLAFSGNTMFVADGNYGISVYTLDTSGIAALFNEGKVGIGTLDPQSLLYVQTLQSGKQDILTLASSFTDGDEGSALVFKDTNAPQIAAARIRSIAGMPGSAGLAFDVALYGQYEAGEAMRILPFSGYVGIGTTTPISRLSNASINTLDEQGTGINYSSGLSWNAPDAGYVISAVNSSSAINGNGLFVQTVGTASTNRILNLNANGRDVFTVRGDGSINLGKLDSSIGIEPVANYGGKGGDLTISAGGGTAGANKGGSLILKAGNANTGDGADHAGDIKLYAGANDYSEGSILGSVIFYKGEQNGVTSESMRIDSYGRVGIGTSSPRSALSVNYQSAFDSMDGFSLVNSDSGNWPAVITVGNSAVMSRISAGNGAATFLIQAGGTGGVYMGSGDTSWTSNSDARLKQNVTDLTATSTLEKILALNPVSFNWVDSKMSSSTQYGFIAQDVLKVFPELVTQPKDPTKCVPGADAANDCYGLNYDRFGVFAIAAIKDIAGFTGVFKDNLIMWLGNAKNGLTKIFVGEVHSNKLCATKADGTEVCVTGEDLEKIASSVVSTSTSSSTSTLESTTTPVDNGSVSDSVVNYTNENGISSTTPQTEENNSGGDNTGTTADTASTADSASAN